MKVFWNNRNNEYAWNIRKNRVSSMFLTCRLASLLMAVLVILTVRAEEITSIAVIGPVENKIDDSDLAEKARERIIAEFRNHEGVYVWEQDMIYSVLLEQKYSKYRSCRKTKCLKKIGRLLGVTIVISGVIERDGHLLECDLTMTDVSGGKPERSIHISVYSNDSVFINKEIPAAVAALTNQNPVAFREEGEVHYAGGKTGKTSSGENPKKSRINILVIPGLVVLAAAAGGVYYLKNKQNKSPTEKPDEAEDIPFDDIPTHGNPTVTPEESDNGDGNTTVDPDVPTENGNTDTPEDTPVDEPQTPDIPYDDIPVHM